MSLTGHLKDRNSPICQFLRTQFPNTRSFLEEARKQIRRAGTIQPDEDVPWGVIGTALDYRIRYYFGITPHEKLAAYRGSETLSDVQRIAQSFQLGVNSNGSKVDPMLAADVADYGYQGFFDSLDELLKRISPAGIRLAQPQEDSLNRYCVILSLMEQVYRVGIFPENPLMKVEFPDTKTLLGIAQPHWIDDIRELSWEFYDKCSHLLQVPHVLNPTFDGSNDVDGADADLIIDGILIDIKATKRPMIDPDWMRQVLGYVLLDYSDHHRINGVGLYMARQGILFRWTLDEVIEGLCADKTASVNELRNQFAECVKDLK